MKRFPKDCNPKCPHYSNYDLSIDDLVICCDLLNAECDLYDADYNYEVCPLNEDELKDIYEQNKILEVSMQDRQQIINQINDERDKQDLKWGVQNHLPERWVGILGEEYGEFCQAVNETIFYNGSDKGGHENIRIEAIQIAAVAIAFLECLDRNKEKWWL